MTDSSAAANRVRFSSSGARSQYTRVLVCNSNRYSETCESEIIACACVRVCVLKYMRVTNLESARMLVRVRVCVLVCNSNRYSATCESDTFRKRMYAYCECACMRACMRAETCESDTFRKRMYTARVCACV